jgi:uncharacterized Zn-finger protein
MAFAHSTALKMHVRRHTGERPFKCLICPEKAFSQLPHLKKHMLSIHKTSKPYMCTACKSYFKTKIQLHEHFDSCEKGPVKLEPEQDIGMVSMLPKIKPRVDGAANWLLEVVEGYFIHTVENQLQHALST